MEVHGSTPFTDMLGTGPVVIRQLLRSALRLNDIEDLYAEARKSNAASLSQSVLEVLNVSVQVSDQDIQRIPSSGPVIIVANHPFGLLDGLALDQVLLRSRSDVKILANELVCGLNEMRARCIPVDVFQAGAGHETNVKAAREALKWLHNGHGIATFPSGEVSHWRHHEKCITDPPWSIFAVRCARKANASIVPVYFKGENSLAFQMAGLLHPRLRTARLPIELLNKRASTVEVRIGTPVAIQELLDAGSDELATRYVRARVYMLSRRMAAPPKARTIHKFLRTNPPSLQPVGAPVQGAAAEIARLDAMGLRIVETDTYAVYAERGEKIPILLSEIGRLRELTFREVGEGTGKTRDLDVFDDYYTQLILWHKETSTVAGSYRLAWTGEVIRERGIAGLYTSTLFRYEPEFFSRIGAAVELGRSFIAPDHQKNYAPLLLLWQAIARCVARRPEAPVLFGAVSISATYSEASREMMVDFLRQHCFRADVAGLLTPRRAFRSRLTRKYELDLITKCLKDVEALPIADIESHSGVPVLLRQYLRLGGRVAGFNVDAGFSHVLDGLLIVDLRETSRKLLAKYMGPEVESFLQSATCNFHRPLYSLEELTSPVNR